MKIRKIAALILACSMVTGQAVYAEELQGDVSVEENTVISGDLINTDGTENLPDEISGQEDMEDEKEEKIVQDSEEQIQDKSVNMIQEQEDDIENYVNEKELKLYMNYDRIIEVKSEDVGGNFSIGDYQVQVDDPSICSAEIVDKKYVNLYVKVHSMKSGSTVITISGKGEENQGFAVRFAASVGKLPEDAAAIKDIALRSSLFNEYLNYDKNGDGYISVSELEKVSYLSLSNSNITDVSGLERAVSLVHIDLSNNLELKDIMPLYQLESLKYCDIRRTGISDEECWRLADFKDMEISKGDKLELPTKYCISDVNTQNSDLIVEAIENETLISLEPSKRNQGIISLTALEPGTVKLKVSYKTFISEITIKINGIDTAQEVGDEYTDSVNNIEGIQAEGVWTNSGILKSNGELWETYPEAKKVKNNVKKYVADWIYKGNNYRNRIPVRYTLDFDDILWNSDEKIASDVKKFDGHYALDSQGTLKDLYNKDTEELHDVADWVVAASLEEEPTCVYVLKEDGTVWSRQELSAEQKSNLFVKIAEGVAAVDVVGYLCTDGRLYTWNSEEPVAVDVQRLGRDAKRQAYLGGLDSYYGTDGYFYAKGMRSGQYCRIGKIDVQYYMDCYLWNGSSMDEEKVILSKEGKLFVYSETEGLTEADSDVREFNLFSDEQGQGILYRKNDGSCYTLEGEKIEVSMKNPYIITGVGPLDLVDTGDENNWTVRRNKVGILDHVIKIWKDNDQYFALRTDGTIWNITDVPRLILDLATDTYVMGDVNEDGVVNIEDLRIVLRSVCGKIELSERQLMIADVVPDDGVDIQDLRKILRFVCGKITEL